MTKKAFRGLFLCAVLGALAFRVVRLDLRPMHADEANQAVKFGDLLERGQYRFDPQDHHGPTLYYLTLPAAWAAREKALANPRIDMPGAEATGGVSRNFNPPPLPVIPLPLAASISSDGLVELAWERSGRTIGLDAELHRSTKPLFKPDVSTLLLKTTLRVLETPK